MGNHDVGRAMDRTARLLIGRRKEGESALELLDAICEPYRGSDAEFDDALFYGEPLAELALEAFAPGQSFDDDIDGEGFYEGVIRPFRKRYDFC